ncbi:MAG: DoxX family protein [Patescibacteria group bacterium]
MDQKLSPYAPILLRFTLVLVYAYFGISQLTNPEAWTSLVPSWASELTGLSPTLLVYSNASFEVVASLLLLLGIFVRPVALLLFAHLIVIASGFGLSPTGVRDFGLSFSTLALAFFGQDKWCLYPKNTNASRV